MRTISIIFFSCFLSTIFSQSVEKLGSLDSNQLADYMVAPPKIAAKFIKKIDSTYGEVDDNHYDSIVKYYKFSNSLTVYKYVAPFNYKGEEIELSGVVIVPQKNKRDSDIVYFHGTNPPYKAVPKPSDFNLKDKPKKMYFELQYVMMLADLGYTVFVPDYIGYASSEQVEHPYTVSEPNVKAAYNSYNIIKEAYKELFSSSPKLISIGVSEGGAYALGFHKYVEQCSSDYKINSYPCEGPYDYDATLKWVFNNEPKTKFGVLIYVWSAYSQIDYYFPKSRFKDSLFLIKNISQKRILKLTRFLAKNNTPYRYVNKEYVDQILDGENSEMNFIMKENVIYKNWNPIGDICLFHSGRDQVVPILNTTNAYEYLSKRSDNIRYKLFPKKGHRTLAESYFGFLIEELK